MAKITADKIYLLQHTDASFSLSLEEELVDSIIIASTEESVIDEHIASNKIILGLATTYHNNREFYTKKCLPLVGGKTNIIKKHPYLFAVLFFGVVFFIGFVLFNSYPIHRIMAFESVAIFLIGCVGLTDWTEDF